MNQQQYDEFNALAKSHHEQDMLVKGSYGGMAYKFRGCSVGCLAHDALLSKQIKRGEEIDSSSIHKKLADHFDYPEWLCLLQDNLFENTDMTFHVDFAEAMPVDFDNWQSLLHRIHARILREIALPHAGDSAADVIRVIELHESESTDYAAWSAAWSAAWPAEELAERSATRSAAESATRSAAWPATRSAAWPAVWLVADSATDSAAWPAVWSATDSEAESAAWSAERSAAESRICGIVLTEMRACK